MSNTAEQYAETNPVRADRVARRALVMSAIVCRGSIENGAGKPEAESLHRRILDWIARLRLEEEVEPCEHEILNTQLGKLDSRHVIQATWSVEGLAILAWALNRLNLPRHDEKVDSYVVAESLNFLGEDAAELMHSAALRSTAELGACRELMYAIHSRLRDFARNKTRKNFTTWIEKAWLDVLKVDPGHLTADNDLAINDKTIDDVEQERLQSCEWVICERHRASIWLLGGYPVYSQTPADT